MRRYDHRLFRRYRARGSTNIFEKPRTKPFLLPQHFTPVTTQAPISLYYPMTSSD
jgi:hypothetical protein